MRPRSGLSEYSLTDPREDGQLSWLEVNGFEQIVIRTREVKHSNTGKAAILLTLSTDNTQKETNLRGSLRTEGILERLKPLNKTIGFQSRFKSDSQSLKLASPPKQ